MIRVPVILQVITGLLLISPSIELAHHNFVSEFDVTKPTHLEGRVTQVIFGNPHVQLIVSAKDTNGELVLWNVQTSPPHILQMVGWNKDTIQPGMDVRIGGYAAKNGSKLFGSTTVTAIGSGRTIKTPTCWTLSGNVINLVDISPPKCGAPEVP